jgi:CBS domain containing-hemolysin-like protein
MLVAALLLALAALAEASCALPGRRSLRELVTFFSEPQRQNGLDFQRLQAARAGAQTVELLGVGLFALALADLLQRETQQSALVTGLLVLVTLVAVLGRALPDLLLPPDLAAPPAWAQRLAMALAVIASPILWASRLARRLLGYVLPRPVSAPAVAVAPEVLAEPAAPAVPEPEEEQIISRVLRLDRLTARDVMVPRMDVVAVPLDTPVSEIVEIARTAGHSRIAVYRGSIDSVVGVVYIKDLLRFIGEPAKDIPAVELMRPAYFVPESKRVDELLHDLQQQRVHLAIVVDEFGGTAGLVTIEDVLEEIVGEIQDEYDTEAPLIERVGADEVIVDGRIGLDEVSDLFEVSLHDEETTTLGGLVQRELGHIPQAGECVQIDGLRIEVLSVDRHRVRKLRLLRLPVVDHVSPVPSAKAS